MSWRARMSLSRGLGGLPVGTAVTRLGSSTVFVGGVVPERPSGIFLGTFVFTLSGFGAGGPPPSGSAPVAGAPVAAGAEAFGADIPVAKRFRGRRGAVAAGACKG